MNIGLRNSNGYHRIMIRETISSKMRMKAGQEKSNSWPLAVDTSGSPHLTLTIGSGSEATYKRGNI